ncbi:MAG TPA: hypothetical protein VHA56_05630 [Mucilaginibacter sp.]|nr:hypothetical protein [Mucilaginibacter sp.]
MRAFKLIARFYRGIFPANFAITVSCLWLISSYGEKATKLIGVLFWYKIITITIVFFGWLYYHHRQLYYYQNLGISKLKLAITTTAADFLIWTGAMFIAFRLISH